MKIELRFFASVREKLNCSEEVVDVPSDITTVGSLRLWLAQRDANWGAVLAPQRALRTAFNQQMCEEAQSLSEGAEVAFFPPVTGG